MVGNYFFLLWAGLFSGALAVSFSGGYPPVNKHSNGKSPSWIGNTSSNGGFSIAMLDYRRVTKNKGETFKTLTWHEPWNPDWLMTGSLYWLIIIPIYRSLYHWGFRHVIPKKSSATIEEEVTTQSLAGGKFFRRFRPEIWKTAWWTASNNHKTTAHRGRCRCHGAGSSVENQIRKCVFSCKESRHENNEETDLNGTTIYCWTFQKVGWFKRSSSQGMTGRLGYNCFKIYIYIYMYIH